MIITITTMLTMIITGILMPDIIRTTAITITGLATIMAAETANLW